MRSQLSESTLYRCRRPYALFHGKGGYTKECVLHHFFFGRPARQAGGTPQFGGTPAVWWNPPLFCGTAPFCVEFVWVESSQSDWWNALTSQIRWPNPNGGTPSSQPCLVDPQNPVGGTPHPRDRTPLVEPLTPAIELHWGCTNW